MKIGLVCGSFHKKEVEKMLEDASNEASKHELTISEVVWVPGAMEVPLALDRLLSSDDISGAACLGIIEKGQTQHGLAIGQAVIKSIIELQIVHQKPVGLGRSQPNQFPALVEPIRPSMFDGLGINLDFLNPFAFFKK